MALKQYTFSNFIQWLDRCISKYPVPSDYAVKINYSILLLKEVVSNDFLVESSKHIQSILRKKFNKNKRSTLFELYHAIGNSRFLTTLEIGIGEELYSYLTTGTDQITSGNLCWNGSSLSENMYIFLLSSKSCSYTFDLRLDMMAVEGGTHRGRF